MAEQQRGGRPIAASQRPTGGDKTIATGKRLAAFTITEPEAGSDATAAKATAKLVGDPTYGKDSVQLVFDLKDKSSLHVTAAKWWAPGKTVPLQPDFPVADDPNSAAILVKAVQVVEMP